MRQSLSLTFICLPVIAILWGGWRWVEDRRYRAEVAQAERDMAGGRHRLARQRLANLTKRHPFASEAAYDLGECEDRLGHPEAALTAWSSVAPDSPLYTKTAVARAWLLIQSGRLALAEQAVEARPHLDGPEAPHVLQVHEHLLRIEGRTKEARELIIESWRGARDPSDRAEAALYPRGCRVPARLCETVLKTAIPSDDRVWLGQANLAIWRGDSTRPARWLDACEKRRPDDQPVWLARLALAMASAIADAARRARGTSGGRLVPAVRSASAPRLVRRLSAAMTRPSAESAGPRSPRSPATPTPGPGSPSWPSRRAGFPRPNRSARNRRKPVKLRETIHQLLMLDERSRHADELGAWPESWDARSKPGVGRLIQQGRAATEPLWPAPPARRRRPGRRGCSPP